ncbi:hypothetical protein ACGFIF_42905 [Kribbella sp. NPDC049174]|uniref:hypothetical protein n=1 Tax=Kribbella sp. NPDC049174 TaxID=3364112 RepID=UPI003710E856
MRQGRTLTKHLNLETRQYDLLIIDLNEGTPRKQLVLSMVSFLLWCLLLAPFLRFPGPTEVPFYIAPPALFAYFAWQKSPSHDGRRHRLTDWAIRVRYALVGHQPVISLGSRKPSPTELIPLRERLPIDSVWRFLDFRQGPTTAWTSSRKRSNRERLPAAPAVEIYQSVRLFDAAQITAARDKSVRQLTKQQRRIPQGA